MNVRCPQCNAPIELVDQDQLDEISCPSCGSSFSLLGDQSTSTFLREPIQLGHFQLLNQVGVGKFGVVWRARDTQMDRIVAVKVPRNDQLSAEEAEFFLREARAAAQVKHPNLVAVHEIGRDGDTVFIVSDFIDGANLREWLTGQQLTTRESVSLLLKVAHAVETAHRAGVVHRDLKPGNIMMRNDGEPFVTDFGLAKRAAGERTLTVAGQILGTPAYMPPEQARGEGHHADARSDVYSLGVILFELLTGDLPFRGQSRMLLVQIETQEPPSPRKFNAHVTRDLETIVLKCLQKEPGRRYQQAGALADDLRRFLEDEPIKARPIGTAERGWRWCKRNPLVAGLAAAVFVALTAGFAISTILFFRAESAREVTEIERQRAVAAEADAELQRDLAERALSDSQHAVYAANLQLADYAIASGRATSARTYLDACPADLRQWEWDYLNWNIDKSAKTLSGHDVYVTGVDFSPDGQTLVTGSLDKTVRLWDASSGREIAVLSRGESRIGHVAWDPAGRWIAAARSDGKVDLWNATTRQRIHSIDAHTDRVCHVEFSNDGRRLVSTGGEADQRICLWDPSTGELLQSFVKQDGTKWSAAFSRDGRLVASATWGHNVQIWKVDTGELLHHLSGHRGRVNGVAFSRDGSVLLSGADDARVIFWDVESGRVLHRLVAHRSDVNEVAFSPDGKHFATASRDQTLRVWDYETRTLLNTVGEHRASVVHATFSPDGAWLASSSRDGTAKIWNPWAEEKTVVQSPYKTPVVALEALPNNRFLAASSDGMAHVWDAGRMTPVGESLDIPVHDFGIKYLGISEDGRRAAYLDRIERRFTIKNLENGKVLASTPVPFFQQWFAVAMSPDGRYAALGVDYTVWLWDYEHKELPATIASHGRAIEALRFTPDGSRLLTGSGDRLVKVWDVDSGKLLNTISGHVHVIHDIRFGPDRGRLATASWDATIRIWDASNFQSMAILKGHSKKASAVAFHPRGNRLASAGADNTVRIWSLATMSELLTLPTGADGRPFSIAFVDDGATLVAGCQSGAIRVWQTGPSPGDFQPRFDATARRRPDSATDDK